MINLTINGKNIFGVYTKPDLVNQWQELKWKEFTATETGNIKLFVRFYDVADFDGQEDVYLDDFSAVKTGDAVTPTDPTEPTVPTEPTSNGSDFTCATHLMQGAPSSATQLCREGYVVGFDTDATPSKKVAEWVAYHVTKASVNITIPRVDEFKPDSQLPSKDRAQLSDYSYSGYSRGHLAPYAAMDFTQSSGDESFLLSNMAPQLQSLNGAGWAGLESRVRTWANIAGELDVVTGPIWTSAGTEDTIGNGVFVPDAFYKVILDVKAKKAIAFIFPHEAISTSDLANYIVTVDEVELQTGLDFFNKLPDTTENDIEAVAPALWDVQ